MKNTIILVCLIFFTNLCCSQNQNIDYNSAVKLYNLSTYDNTVSYTSDSAGFSVRQKSDNYRILHPTIAFQWKSKKNNFHEIELTNLSLHKAQSVSEKVVDTSGIVQSTLNRGNLVSTSIALRYEYIVNFFKARDTKIVPSLGLSLGSFYSHNNYLAGSSGSFNRWETSAGIRTFVIPRLSYYLSSRLFLDLNLPVSFFELYSTTRKNENPAIPVNQQKITNFNLEVFPKIFSARLGVGFKL